MPPDPQRSPPASCLNTTKANLGLSPARARCGSGTCSPASPCRQTHVFPRMHPVGSQGQWGRRTPSVLPPGASASPCPAVPAATPGGAGPCAELSVHHHPHHPVPCGHNNPGCPLGTAGSPRTAFPAPQPGSVAVPHVGSAVPPGSVRGQDPRPAPPPNKPAHGGEHANACARAPLLLAPPGLPLPCAATNLRRSRRSRWSRSPRGCWSCRHRAPSPRAQRP